MNNENKIILDLPADDIGWISSLLLTGLIEHQSSYGDMIPVPDSISKYIYQLRKKHEND